MINKILIIEDEQSNAERLERLILALRPKATVIAVLESISDTVEWFSGDVIIPDVVMMDVKLSDGISFKIFEKVKIKCPIIFTTAFDEYAVRAFKYNSIDYLLKPVEQEELQNAFEKLELLLLNTYEPKLEGLLDFLKAKEFRTRFVLPYKDQYKFILVNDIDYFYSELKITKAKLSSGEDVIISQSLEDLENELNPKEFFRVNRQMIVHKDAIRQIHNYFSGKLKLEIKNGPNTEIIVSRHKAYTLKCWMAF